MTIKNQITSFKLSGITFSGTSTQLNYTSGVTGGTALPNKALVLDSNGNISGINTLTANVLNITNITGSVLTPSQPNITTIGTLTNVTVAGNVTISNHNGTTTGLILGATLVTSSAAQLNYNNITTPGVAQASKALILDVSGNINNINSLTTSNILTTNFTLGGTLITASGTQINYNKITTTGVAQASTTLVLDSNRNITNINSLSATNIIATNLTGTLLTPAQPNITSVGTLTSLNLAGDITGIGNLTLSGTLSGATSISATNLTGTLTTTAQPNITSVGSLISLTVAGAVSSSSISTSSLVLNSVTVTASATQLNYNNITTIGIAQPSKSLVLDSNSNITGINSLTAASLIATNLTGTLQTVAQPLITSVGTLTSLTLAGAISGVTNLSMSGNLTGASSISATNITGTLQTAAQTNITSVGTLNNLNVVGAIGCKTTTPALSVEINDPTGQCLRLSYNAPTGSATNYANFTVNSTGQLNIAPSGNLVNINGSLIVGNSGTANTIQFNGVTGMTGNNMTVISEQLFNNNTAAYAELLLFKGNSTTIPSRIRSRAGQHIFQTYTSTEDYSTLNDNNTRMIITNSGFIGMNTITPNRNLEINSGGNVYGLRLTYNASANFTDIGTDNYGNLNIVSSNGTTIFGSSSNTNQTVLIGANSTTASNGVMTIGTNSGVCTISAGVNTTAGSAADFTIVNAGQTINNSSRKFILKSSGNLGIGTTSPNRLTELNDANGNCLRLSYNAPTGSATTYCDQTISSAGIMTFNVAGSNPSFVFSGGNISGTLSTPAQPNITSIGTLPSLTLSGAISGVTNLTMSGTLTGATSISATSLLGTLTTAAQTNITSVGSLTSLGVTGNTKIGVPSNPAQDILHIENTTNAFPGIQIQNKNSTATTSGCKISFTGFNSTNNNYELARIASITVDSGATNTQYQFGALAFYTRRTVLSTGASEGMRLTNNGFLGINTTTPAYVLDVNGTSRSTQILVGTSTDNSSTRMISALNSAMATGTRNFITLGQANSAYNQAEFSFYYGGNGLTTNYLSLGLNNTTSMAITGAGNVGINTTTPVYNLDVNGTIRANNLILQNGNITGVNSITTTSLTVGGVAITNSGGPYLNGAAPGTATASTALVLDSSRNIGNINYLTANYLTGYLMTVTQPNITSVGTLTSLALSGAITGATSLTVNGQTNISTLSVGNIGLTNSSSIYQSSHTPAYQGNWPQSSYWAIGNDPSIESTIRMGTISAPNATSFSGYASLSAQNIYTQGYAGIGTNSPSYLLDVSYVSSPLPGNFGWYLTGGYGGAGTSYSNANISARFQGRILVAGEVDIYSDRRIKTDIYDLSEDFCKSFIQKTTPVHYKYNNTDDVQSHYGYIAQDVIKAGFTELVTIHPHEGIDETTDDDGFVSPKDAIFTLCLDEVVPILSKNIKMLYKENEVLKQKNADLMTMINKLSDCLDKLENK